MTNNVTTMSMIEAKVAMEKATVAFRNDQALGRDPKKSGPALAQAVRQYAEAIVSSQEHNLTLDMLSQAKYLGQPATAVAAAGGHRPSTVTLDTFEVAPGTEQLVIQLHQALKRQQQNDDGSRIKSGVGYALAPWMYSHRSNPAQGALVVVEYGGHTAINVIKSILARGLSPAKNDHLGQLIGIKSMNVSPISRFPALPQKLAKAVAIAAEDGTITSLCAQFEADFTALAGNWEEHLSSIGKSKASSIAEDDFDLSAIDLSAWM